ncbi:hypothetical protein HYE67_005252 [Fusarium culmorum]|uniref:Fucose-specific lectin n=1 Tax=Fusarium culmorum TaxID=5516 RepID=A0A2T4GYF7_FUSCU|nr:hypothetical protein FCULG_00012426 [Fusarium culmorum]QPC63021.1 hypothetical protein HYE67_005252 [Fusarium culmorum]
MVSTRILVRSVLYWLAWLEAVNSQSIAAFYTDQATQIGAQDANTGNIIYSFCNSVGTPVFPVDDPNVLSTKRTPRNGTALTMAGWFDTQKITASIFYQSDNGDIVNGYYECDPSSGKLIRKGEYAISEIAALDSVHKFTGLRVELLGNTLGYRLFYHDEKKVVKTLSYTPDTNWVDAGVVSPDPVIGMGLGSHHRGKGNVTVTFPQGSDNLMVAQNWNDGLYHLESLPQPLNGTFTNQTQASEIETDTSTPEFTLPSWDAESVSIATSVDSTRARHIFYIGTDKKLHELREEGVEWNLAANESEKTWPTADTSSAPLAVSYQQSQGETWIYYLVNGSIIEAHRDGSGYWDDAKTLPTQSANATDGGVSAGGDDSKKTDGKDPDSADASVSHGLTAGAKAGIGIGAGVGAVLVAGVIWFLFRRRGKSTPVDGKPLKKGADVEPEGGLEDNKFRVSEMAAESQPLSHGYAPPPQYKPQTMDNHIQPVELASPTVIYEMPVNGGSAGAKM